MEEGLTVVKAVRSRYDGRVRNPFNEYECGNYYARAMASYALLGALSGFRYSAVERAVWLAPKVSPKSFTVFFSTESGFGTITLADGQITIHVVEGALEVDMVHLTLDGETRDLPWGVTVRAGQDQSIGIN